MKSLTCFGIVVILAAVAIGPHLLGSTHNIFAQSNNVPPPSFLQGGNVSQPSTANIPNQNVTTGFQSPSNFTDGQQPGNETAGNVSDIRVYANRVNGVFMLYPANWTASTAGLADYTQLVAYHWVHAEMLS